VASSLKLHRNGAVGFIDWLDVYGASVTFSKFWWQHQADFVGELKRRNLYKVAIAYGAVGVAEDPEVQAMTQPTNASKWPWCDLRTLKRACARSLARM